jgi:hypothetical protein
MNTVVFLKLPIDRLQKNEEVSLEAFLWDPKRNSYVGNGDEVTFG